VQTYSYPLDIQLKFENKRVVVAFGERDGVCIGHVLMSVNGQPLTYKELPDGKDVFEVSPFVFFIVFPASIKSCVILNNIKKWKVRREGVILASGTDWQQCNGLTFCSV
jgi:hypothetical protein